MENQCIERSILNTIISAGAKAITDYLDMTGDAGAWATPEFWLKSEIARALMQEKKYYLYLEHRVSDLRRFANDGREIPLTLQGDRQAGRVDIALYNRTLKPENAELKAIIEVKKMTNDWCFNEDAARIIELSRIWGGVCGIVGGLFFCKDEQQARSLFAETEKRLAEVQNVSSVKVETSPLIVNALGVYSGIAAARVC